eukprot:jgi/Chrzof1/12242/Cz06g26230.t1
MAVSVTRKGSGTVGSTKTSTLRPNVRPVCAPRRVVKVNASVGEAFNWVGQAFVKIFSPPSDNKVSWTGTTTPFTGKVSHHGAGRPFKDGFVASKAQQEEYAKINAESAANSEGDMLGYVGDAVERVVGHNFTGDGNEPATRTGSSGWKGDIHSRDTDGFHTKKF